MRRWELSNIKSPIWFVLGLITVIIVISITFFFIIHGPKSIKSVSNVDDITSHGTLGKIGTVTEPLGHGLLTLSYESIIGSKDNLQLLNVNSKFRELENVWEMKFPCAQKIDGVWTLLGPAVLTFADSTGNIFGSGLIDSNGPALKWNHGLWYGLSPMIWNDRSGQDEERWVLPAGWYRNSGGRFVVEDGPVSWFPGKKRNILSIDANKMYVDPSLREGHMEDVTANLIGGQIKSKIIDIDKINIYWSGMVSFIRNDGWCGQSSGGNAKRLTKNSDFKNIELNDPRARRVTTEGTELMSADRAQWVKNNLILVGNVHLDQPSEGTRISLRANTVFQRNSLDGDFPSDMPVGATRADQQATLSWGDKHSVRSHRIEFIEKTHQWSIASPTYGRSRDGTFSAGSGRGCLARWTFDGPILANFGDGFVANGDLLVWENDVFTLTGKPVLVNRFREQFAGHRFVLSKKILEFPDGISATLATIDEDISIRANCGKVQRTLINFFGGVECSGRDWVLKADSISVKFGKEHKVEQINGSGGISLCGRIGNGAGETISLDLNKKMAHWFGKVKATVGVSQ